MSKSGSNPLSLPDAQHAESVAKGMRLERERMVEWLRQSGKPGIAQDVERGIHWRWDDPLLNDGVEHAD